MAAYFKRPSGLARHAAVFAALALTAGGVAACGSNPVGEDLVLTPKDVRPVQTARVTVTDPHPGERIQAQRFTVRGTGGPAGATVVVDTGTKQYKVKIAKSGKWGVHDVKRPAAGTGSIKVEARGKSAADRDRVTVSVKYG